VHGDVIRAGDTDIRVLADPGSGRTALGRPRVDVVVESTGRFNKAVDARKHIDAGARKVVISAPATGEDITIVMGVNDGQYDPASHDIISNASCTTNCVAPMAKVLMDSFGIVKGMMTRSTPTPAIRYFQDFPHKDLRRAPRRRPEHHPDQHGRGQGHRRLVLPELKGKLDGMSMRVPVIDGSVTDLVVQLGREASVDEVNAAYQAAADGSAEGLPALHQRPIVSSDIVARPYSCTFGRSLLTMAIGDQSR